MDARPNGIALHSQQSLASIDVADERINFSGEPVENGIVDPGLLDEFKLPFDVAVETDEMQAPLLPVLDQWIGRAGSVGAAAAEQPVPASAGQRILRIVSEGIARISAAHVSAEGAGKPVRIELRVLEVVFVSQVRTILTGRLDQRSAAFQRPTNFAPSRSRAFSSLSPFDVRVASSRKRQKSATFCDIWRKTR